MISLRPATEQDLPFIYSTWLKGLYYGWPHCPSKGLLGLTPYPTYRGAYRSVLQGILARNRATVACLTDSPDVVVAYSIVSPDETTVHFVYTKRAWRKLGVARSLVPRDARYVTHLTRIGLSLLSKLPRAEYNPFLL